MFKFSRAIQLTVLAAAVLGGIVFGRAGYGVWGQLPLACFGLAALVKILRLRLSFEFLLIGCLTLGVWRGNATELAKTELGKMIGQKVTLTGRIADDPALNSKNRLVFNLGDLRQNSRPISGTLRVTTSSKKLQRGYGMEVSGKIGPSFGSVPVQMSFGQTTVESTDVSKLERLRQRFFAAMRSALPDPLSGFALGLLVGVRGLVPDDLQKQLALVGLSHLVAVSGYNLTIIINAARRLLQRHSTYLATAVSVWLIAGFLLVTGFGASIVRAALVAGLAMLTSYYGYRIKPIALIALPAALTAAINPDYLMRDIGWQLSFLAFFGIVVLAPLIENRLRRQTLTTSLIIQALAAQLLTFPLIAITFNQLSVVSPLTNALLVPLVPLAMLLSLVTGIAAMLVPTLAGWLALPATGLLAIMVGVVQMLAAWPDSSWQVSISAEEVAAAYAAIVVLTVVLWRGRKPRQHPAPELKPALQTQAL
jgi:competence protein ComEC